MAYSYEYVTLWKGKNTGDVMRRRDTVALDRVPTRVVENLSRREVDWPWTDPPPCFDKRYSVYDAWLEAAERTKTPLKDVKRLLSMGEPLSYYHAVEIPVIGIVEIAPDGQVRTSIVRTISETCLRIYFHWRSRQLSSGRHP